MDLKRGIDKAVTAVVENLRKQSKKIKDSSEIARAAIPFFSMLVLTIAIISVFPQVVTWLPDAVMGAAKK